MVIALQTRLARCESVIQQGLDTFVAVGNALLEIRDGRLYKDSYSTFEDYCRERWGWERRHAYRLMDAAQVVENVSLGTQILPESERQARPLTQLSPEQQREAWQRATESGNKVTASRVQEEVDAILNKPHVAQATGQNEWYTPSCYAEAARAVLGSIDVDPASSEIANRIIKATTYYTAADSGLTKAWLGNVWMNPPYAQPLVTEFCNLLAEKYRSGEVKQACVLVNNATETNWFQTLLSQATAVCFVKHRVRFLDTEGNGGGSPLQGQAILYLGPNPLLFAESFRGFGVILYGR